MSNAVKKAEAKVLETTMARYVEWAKEYPEGLRPKDKGGIQSEVARRMVRACIHLAKLRKRKAK